VSTDPHDQEVRVEFGLGRILEDPSSRPVTKNLDDAGEVPARPVSAGIAVPIFAFLSAGVTAGGLSGLGTSLTDRVAVAVMGSLVVGKTVGISLATWLVARFTRAHLDEGPSWTDVIGLSMLGGIGFTVSLLIGELAFGFGTEQDSRVKVAVLAGSLAAALLAAVVLRGRNRAYRRIRADDLEPSVDYVGARRLVECGDRRGIVPRTYPPQAA
jgi:Na+:H+ antiporter, NhaA family